VLLVLVASLVVYWLLQAIERRCGLILSLLSQLALVGRA